MTLFTGTEQTVSATESGVGIAHDENNRQRPYIGLKVGNGLVVQAMLEPAQALAMSDALQKAALATMPGGKQ
jgi:hypothetical protein